MFLEIEVVNPKTEHSFRKKQPSGAERKQNQKEQTAEEDKQVLHGTLDLEDINESEMT